MTKKITLHYFDMKGRAEPIRYLLAYKKVDYTDHRFAREEWPQLKQQMPNHQVPVLDVDGKHLTQSAAILFYLGNEYGLTGKNSWDNAKLMEVDGAITDLMICLRKWFYEQDAEKKSKIAEELKAKEIPEGLRNLERIAQLDQDHKFILGDNPAWADFQLASFTERLSGMFFQGNAAQLSTALAGHLERVQSLSGVKEYIAKRPQTDM